MEHENHDDDDDDDGDDEVNERWKKKEKKLYCRKMFIYSSDEMNGAERK